MLEVLYAKGPWSKKNDSMHKSDAAYHVHVERESIGGY